MIVDYIELLKMVKEGKFKDGDVIERISSDGCNVAGNYIFFKNNFHLEDEDGSILEEICDYERLFNCNFKIENVATETLADYHEEFKEIIKLLKEMRDKIK